MEEEKTGPYAYLTPENIRHLMLDYGIVGDRARQTGKPSVRKLAELAGLNYDALNKAMNGSRPHLTELQKAKLHHFFYVRSMEKAIN